MAIQSQILKRRKRKRAYYDTSSEINSSQVRKNRHTLNYFMNVCGFQKPLKVLVDSSAVYHNSTISLLEKIRKILGDKNVEIYTTSCCVHEMKVISQFNETSDMRSNMIRALSDIHAIAQLPCSHKKSYNSSCIPKLIGENNDHKLVVVTSSNTIWESWYDNSQVPVILCQKGGQPILKALSCFVKSPDYLRLMADFERLKVRYKIIRCIEIKVGIGANSQFSAISYQLREMGHEKVGHEEIGHAEVRRSIFKQIQMNYQKYEHLYEGSYPSFVANLPSQETWGERTTLQAAADYYRVRIVVLSSQKDHFFLEWWPSDLIDSTNLKVVFLSYLDGYCYSPLYLHRGPVNVPFQFELNNRLSVEYDYRKTGLNLVPPPARYETEELEYFSNPTKKFKNMLRKRLHTRLQTYKFKEGAIRGGSTCCFRVLAHHLLGSEEEHEDMRTLICEQFESYPENYRDYAFAQYVARMSKLAEWGNNSVLQACADHFKCRIISLGCVESEIIYEFYPQDPDGLELDCTKVIFLTDSGCHNNVMSFPEPDPDPDPEPEPKPELQRELENTHIRFLQ